MIINQQLNQAHKQYDNNTMMTYRQAAITVNMQENMGFLIGMKL